MRFLIVAIVGSILAGAILRVFGIDLFLTFGFAKAVLVVAVNIAFGAVLLRARQLDQNQKNIGQHPENKPQ